jgi:hypothetical protein
MRRVLILIMSFLFVTFLRLESYAGKGFFSCCCCDDGEIVEDRPLLYTCPKEERVFTFGLFKRCIVADGDCDINIGGNYSFLIKETITSGRGNKRIIFNRNQDRRLPDDEVLDFSGRRVTFFANSLVENEGGCIHRITNSLRDPYEYEWINIKK